MIYLFLSYLAFIRYLRHRRANYLENLAQSSLKGATWRVFNLITANDLSFENWLAISARGLLVTYAIPSISSVLRKTGGFTQDVDRRFADMELLIREFSESGAEASEAWDGNPERSTIAIQRLNAIHNQYGSLIQYRDMLYVLTVFMCTTSPFSESRWGQRKITPNEKECIFRQWCTVGRGMNLDVSLWKSFDECQIWKKKYEEERMRFSESNKIVCCSTIDYFIQRFPSFLKPFLFWFALHAVAALQESDAHVRALGLPPPNFVVVGLVDAVLTARAFFCWYLLPPLPLVWTRRLTSLQPVHTSKPESGCPFKMYAPTRDLDYGNRTYRPFKGDGSGGVGYYVEHMGPGSVEKGKLCSTPQYVGSPRPEDKDHNNS